MPAPEAPRRATPTPAGPGPAGVGPRARRRWVTVLASLGLGAAAGVLGTLLHAHFLRLGEAVLPWGAVLALLLVAAVQLWWTLDSAVPWTGGVTAVGAFTAALALGAWPGADVFAVGLTEYTLRVVPGPAIAGAVWLWGLPVVAVLTMLVAQPFLRGPAARD
ncbi:hypothetical protein E7744_05350 [Citricoccus sp. SGAir0253]|uniref:hypothetical protein n=1 Tax=Citricoccus sp. SGAir0253 TaxID=2567881 RepID=UPI0010CCC862|nr:hypothetical protein [Citricoccus sp. SGAir0253]QCU77685.1 hypothetical protein E7744_05350 [Citricoccus sp. SGAir0253]